MTRNLGPLLLLALAALMPASRAAADDTLPTGYLVWSRGEVKNMASRRIFRMTLPAMDEVIPLTSAEAVECQISPDGKWVAYARAKLPGGTDYHQFARWRLFLVSIHGAADGREEIKIDDSGYWPSWGTDGSLYYSQAKDSSGHHTRIIRVRLDDHGEVVERAVILDTEEHFGDIAQVNECFVSLDATWFAARTRGADSGVGAYTLDPPTYRLLAKAEDFGCMPYVAPSGNWGFIAGSEHGIRWGEAPGIPDREIDRVLIPPREPGDHCYHPGIATDEQWVLAAHSTDQEHNAGPYEIYLYKLDASRQIDSGRKVTDGGFNGWPHLWIGEPTQPPKTPRIVRFAPDTWTVVPPGSVTLSWDTRAADEVTLDGEAVAGSGSTTDTPATSATYRLEARNTAAGESAAAEVQIEVTDTPQPVCIARFEVEPDTIEAGSSAVLRWEVGYPTTLDIDGEAVEPAGEREVDPLETTDYVLTAQGHQGPVSITVTLAVQGLDTGLLPDRGGIVCGTALPGGTCTATLLLLAALGIASRRRR